MGKHVSKYVIYPVIVLLTVIVSIYSFSQALQVPLTETNAEKVLSAWNILHHTGSPTAWTFPLPELPFHTATALERVQYVAEVNRLKAKEKFARLSFDRKDKWEDPVWGVPGDRIEKIFDPSRGSTLTVHYYDSEDGVCRTAFASVSGQQHECRQHSCENAWKFIKQFRR